MKALRLETIDEPAPLLRPSSMVASVTGSQRPAFERWNRALLMAANNSRLTASLFEEEGELAIARGWRQHAGDLERIRSWLNGDLLPTHTERFHWIGMLGRMVTNHRDVLASTSELDDPDTYDGHRASVETLEEIRKWLAAMPRGEQEAR